MDGRPTAAELLDAVAEFLEHVSPDNPGSATYEARVAVHVLRLVQRELELGPAIDAAAAAARASLPGAPVDTAALADLIRQGVLDADDQQLRQLLIRDVRARIAVDSPAYASVATAERRWGPVQSRP